MGAVTSAHSDRHDLRCSPEGVCELSLDGCGTEKMFCAVQNNLESYLLINMAVPSESDALAGWRLSVLLSQAERQRHLNHLPEAPCGNLLIIFMMPGQQ